MRYIALLTAFLVLSQIAYSDIGPKPTVDIDVSYDGSKIADSVFYAKMLACYDDESILQESLQINTTETAEKQLAISEFDSSGNCTWLPSRFAWGGECKDSMCSFTYSPPNPFRLAVYIPSINRTFVSSKVYNENFRASYSADLMADGSMSIKDTTFFLMSDSGLTVRNFITSLFITVFLELVVAYLYLSSLNGSLKKHLAEMNRMLSTVILANLVSLPIVWFVFPLIASGTAYLTIAASEAFAVLFEGLVIHMVNKTAISLKRALLLGLAMNVASFLVGGVIFLYLFGFGL